MGNLKELASMIPGVGKAIKDIDIDDRLLKQFDQTRKMMKMVTSNKMAGMMQKMKRK